MSIDIANYRQDELQVLINCVIIKNNLPCVFYQAAHVPGPSGTPVAKPTSTVREDEPCTRPSTSRRTIITEVRLLVHKHSTANSSRYSVWWHIAKDQSCLYSSYWGFNPFIVMH